MRNNDIQAQARALYGQLTATCVRVEYQDADADITLLAHALREAEAKGLERAALVADTFANCMEDDLPHTERLQRLLQKTTAEYIAQRCRQQASAAREE